MASEIPMARTSIFQSIRNREETKHSETDMQTDLPRYRGTYQDKLRLVGMHIDQNRLVRSKIIEVPGGMLVRATLADGIADELLEFPDETFENYFQSALEQRSEGSGRSDNLRIKSELVPTSYSDVLRALGAQLDEWLARSVLISEGHSGIFVTGMRLLDTSVQSRYSPFDELLMPEDIDALLTEAYNRRGTS